MVQKLQLCAREAKLQIMNSSGGGIGGILPSYLLETMNQACHTISNHQQSITFGWY